LTVVPGAGFALPAAWDKCKFPFDEFILWEVKDFFLKNNKEMLQVGKK
jgi:hypothetical protein